MPKKIKVVDVASNYEINEDEKSTDNIAHADALAINEEDNNMPPSAGVINDIEEDLLEKKYIFAVKNHIFTFHLYDKKNSIEYKFLLDVLKLSEEITYIIKRKNFNDYCKAIL
mgnify:CR=1 FL=1